MDKSDPSAFERPDQAAGLETRPLFVDLDGTLIKGDSLWEAAAALAGQNLFSFIVACLALLRGRAAFKRAVAERMKFSLADVKLNDSVFSFTKTESEIRPVILATAADRQIAQSIAQEAGFFSGVIASDKDANLKGAQKLKAIEAYLAQHGFDGAFDYVGDSKADRPIWARAVTAYAVAPDEAAARHVANTSSNVSWIQGKAATPKDFLKAMRLHQWVKNVLIFLPLALSHQLLDTTKVLQAFAAFAAFSLCASATYIINDILDIRADRRHATKHVRPFAAARISIPQGIVAAAVLFALSFSIALTFTSIIVVALLCGYILFTLTYSLYLKEKLLVDAMALGLLYGYRIIIGGAAAAVLVSD
ncbi:MAG: UbiA family prenyltransferase, partial [Pseudomonadota bacterium]